MQFVNSGLRQLPEGFGWPGGRKGPETTKDYSEGGDEKDCKNKNIRRFIVSTITLILTRLYLYTPPAPDSLSISVSRYKFTRDHT